uniref:Uncharacterized protein n=1 Tax=Anguilla anguilla TaxID=7936 RepID=A0A0E9XWJ8_ANGAN
MFSHCTRSQTTGWTNRKHVCNFRKTKTTPTVTEHQSDPSTDSPTAFCEDEICTNHAPCPFSFAK